MHLRSWVQCLFKEFKCFVPHTALWPLPVCHAFHCPPPPLITHPHPHPHKHTYTSTRPRASGHAHPLTSSRRSHTYLCSTAQHSKAQHTHACTYLVLQPRATVHHLLQFSFQSCLTNKYIEKGKSQHTKDAPKQIITKTKALVQKIMQTKMARA